jgi:hypothetical protein
MKFLLILSILFIGSEVLADSKFRPRIDPWSDRLVDPWYNETELEKWVQWRFEVLRPSVRNSRLALIPFTLKYAKKYDLDPFLVAEVMFAESSWRTKVRGKRGELGVLQCHGVAARGFNLENVEEQFDCGAKYLRGSIDKCPSLLDALGRYQSGECSSEVKGSRRRLRAYLRAVSRFREGKK